MSTRKTADRPSHLTNLTLPLVSIGFGIAYLIAGWLGDDLGFGIFGAILMTGLALVLWLLRYRSETVQGLMDRRDERINAIDLKATAFAGTAVFTAIIIAFVVEIARGNHGSQYAWLGAVGASPMCLRSSSTVCAADRPCERAGSGGVVEHWSGQDRRMTRWVRAIRHGWVVTAGVPGPDVDEFAEATEVVAALAGPGGGSDTLLAVQHPHRTPRALAEGLSLVAALPAARRALDRLRASAYRQVSEVVAPLSSGWPRRGHRRRVVPGRFGRRGHWAGRGR